MVNLDRSRRIARSQANAERRYHESVIEKWHESIPDRYRGFSFQEDVASDHWNGMLKRGDLAKIKRYVKKPNNFMILRGPKGTGKTTLAVTLGTHMLDIGSVNVARYVSVTWLLQKFSFPDDGFDPVAYCTYPDLLILDDVGASTESITAHQKRNLWSVIDYRWSHNKPTIMTSNMSISSNEDGQGMVDWFGESAWDRIQDDLALVMLLGDSFRGSD